MKGVIFQSILFLGVSFSTHAAVSVIGPDGKVELFYQNGGNIIAKECANYKTVVVVADCEVMEDEGKRIRRYDDISEFKDVLRAGLRVSEENWDEDMKKKIAFYNKRNEEGIKNLLKKESDLMEKISARENFAKKYGAKAIDANEMKKLKDELARVRRQWSRPNEMGVHIIQKIEREIDNLMRLIADSDQEPYFYIFLQEEKSFTFNILKEFWAVGVISKFKEIPAGSFMMGSPFDEAGRLNDEEGAEGKPVEVHISQPFDMMVTEVTQQQWFEVMGNNLSRYNQVENCSNHKIINGVLLCPDNPVEGVSWSDIQNFAAQLNKQENLKGCDGTPSGGQGCFRLPTEAEWEYAARGGTTTAYSFGSNPEDLSEYAWFGLNSDRRTHKVAQLMPNPYGLYDMHGNVWEWVQDGYVEKLPGGTDPFQPPIAEGVFHVVRGGSWFHIVQDLRSAFRKGVYPNNRYNNIGFRLVKTK